MPPSLASTSGMPNKDRCFHESSEKAGGEGWLYSEQQLCDFEGPRSVGSQQDLQLQLRSAAPNSRQGDPLQLIEQIT